MPIEHVDSRGARQIKPKYMKAVMWFSGWLVVSPHSGSRQGWMGASLVSLVLWLDDIVSVKCGLSTYDHAYDDHDDDVVCCGRKC